jgi:pimeloyl-ACP methyl ester carboxylesterase
MTIVNDPDIYRFLKASTLDRFNLILDDKVASKLTTFLGKSSYDELKGIAAKALATRKQHLSISIPPNLIFIPGVMGSLLLSSKKGGLWWIDARARHHIKDLRLAPGGEKDADPAAVILPCTVDITYEPFFSAVVEREDFNHEIFAYDWRKPIELSSTALRDKISEAYVKNGNEPVQIVAHSMGGLVIRAALMKYAEDLWPKIDRIAFVGTPHYGSPAISGYLKNHLWGFELLAILGLYLDRDTFRSLWGVLNLLPAPRGIYPGTRPQDSASWQSGTPKDPYLHPCANFDMYQASDWDLGLSAEQTDELQKALDATARFHRELYDAHNKLGQEQRDRMAVIAGVGYETLFRLAYQEKFRGLWTKMEKIKALITNDPHRDGDGRVPVASAALENVGELRYVKGVHGDLPMIPEVYNDVFRWLNKESMKLPATPNEALKSHLAGGIPTSDAPHLTQLTTANPATADPGYWSLDAVPLSEERSAEIEEQLDREMLPAFNRVRLL